LKDQADKDVRVVVRGIRITNNKAKNLLKKLGIEVIKCEKAKRELIKDQPSGTIIPTDMADKIKDHEKNPSRTSSSL
jgi:hypothetical protein